MRSRLPNYYYERDLNQAIHEIVFAIHHTNDGQIDEALASLMIADGYIDQVRKQLIRRPPSVPSVASCKNQSSKKRST